MKSHPPDEVSEHGNTRLTALGAAALVVLIAVSDWRITAQIPLGFLYLIPMFLFGRIVAPWAILALATLCTALAEAFDGFPLTVNDGIPRVLLYFSAFAITGLYVHEIQRNRLRTWSYIHEIEDQRDAIQEAESQLEALIESSPAAIVTTDVSGHILMANEAAHHLFGAAPNCLNDGLIQELIPSLANVHEGRSQHPRFRAVMQARGFRMDGDVFLADICFSTYTTVSGPRLTAMIIDTSEELRQYEEASLKQLLEGSRLVAGAMSHEIRNVCGAIAIAHQNLFRGGLVEGDRDFEALGTLVHTLQDLAAVELSYTASQSAEVDLFAALNDLRIVVAPALHEQGVEASWSFDANLPKVWADRSQLLQIFLNLSNNSIRAVSTASAPRLSVRAGVDGAKVFVEFIDNGGGVRDSSQLFHPFQQGAIASGLGLYLSRAFARSMGGDLRYVPSPGHANFILELVSAEREAEAVG